MWRCADSSDDKAALEMMSAAAKNFEEGASVTAHGPITTIVRPFRARKESCNKIHHFGNTIYLPKEKTRYTS